MSTAARITQIDAIIDAKLALILDATTQLAEMTNNPRPTYSLDGQSFSFEGYRMFLLDLQSRENAEIQNLIKTKNIIQPYIFVSRGGGY